MLRFVSFLKNLFRLRRILKARHNAIRPSVENTLAKALATRFSILVTEIRVSNRQDGLPLAPACARLSPAASTPYEDINSISLANKMKPCLQSRSTRKARWQKWGLAFVIFLAAGYSHLISASGLAVGKKPLLFIRIDFEDIQGEPVSQTKAAQVMQTVEDYYREVSDGKLSIETTFTPTFRMPHTAAWYANHHPQRDQDARAAAKAAGFNPAKFDLEIMVFNSAVGGDGVGIYRGKGLWLAPPIGFSGVVHELGHNFGLPHSGVWKAWDGSVIGAGTPLYYGDIYDPMGGGGDDPRNHFNIRSKVLLGWWGPGDIFEVTQSGKYQIYAQDLPGASGPRGLRIVRDARNVYWVEFRQLISENPYMMNGVRILKCCADESGRVDMTSNLLDMTPGSPLGCKDAPLLLGRTFCDDEAGIYITPVAKRSTTPESLDIVVNMGHYTNNHPPLLRLTSTTRTANVGEPIVFRATGNDADGDTLEYSWDFGDGSFEWGKPVATHSWKEPDRDFAVRCSVTDMKGGTATKLLVVTIGHPLLHRLVGVVSSNGKPLENVLIAADTANSTVTVSDGLFVLTDLKSGKHRITARTGGYWVKPVSVDCPETKSIRLLAFPLGRDAILSYEGIELEGDDVLSTPALFRPPVEITIVAKTSATNLRMAYAADQVVFNWEANGTELRVDGGPANGQHKKGMGAIPPNKYVTIRWLVTPQSQAIFVNNELRACFENALM